MYRTLPHQPLSETSNKTDTITLWIQPMAIMKLANDQGGTDGDRKEQMLN